MPALFPAFGLPGWAGFASALAEAERGDASAFSSGLATSEREGFGGLAVYCVDFPRVTGYEDLTAKMRLGRAVAPHTQGASEGWPAITGCMRWPVPLANPPHRASIRPSKKISFSRVMIF